MGKLLRFRPLLILLLILELLCSSIFPQPAYAWSAVMNNSYIIRIFKTIGQFLGGESWESNQDLGSHQLMIKLACEKLAQDPAWKDQEELFPTKDGILGWEGVVVNNLLEGIIWGGEWVYSKRGGPDAEGKTNDSFHYYNPLIPAGGAPDAVADYYNKMLLQLYNGGNFGKSKANDDTNHDAAWSAHFLADVSVPYHTVGIPAKSLKNTLSIKESGPHYLWEPGEAKLDETGTAMDPNSIVLPDDSWGRNEDFSIPVSRFESNYSGEELKDWFDPWYYNGWAKAGPSGLIGSGSHASWEAWAHQFIVKNKLAVVPAAYSKEWKNAAPKFGVATINLENQAAQAKSFTIAAALETSKNINMATYTKKPEGGFNKAVERMATLWRASLTALRPTLRVTPDPANPKLLHVIAIIQSVEPADPAKGVRAKLTADGGTVRGDDSPTLKADVTSTAPGILTWDVDASNPDSCKLRMEVICTYANTPDLQYSVVEPGKDKITVEVSPSQVKAGDKVKLTVKVQPAVKTELTVTNWGPLEKKSDLFSFWKKADLTTDGTGTFSGEFTVSKTTKDGSYDIKVADSKSKAAGSTKIYVGLNIKNSTGVYIRFMYSVKHTFVNSNRSGISTELTVLGDNPQTKITSWEGDYTVNAIMVTAHPNETGTLKLTLDNNYETITSFTWNYKHTNSDPRDTRSITTTITGSGLKKGGFVSYLGSLTGVPDFYYKLMGQDACSNIKVKSTRINQDGSTDVLTGSSCGTNTISDFLFTR